MELKGLISDYLAEAKLMQLSTCNDNKPWTCSVWFATDDELTIYWFSSVTRRHSQEIEKNPNVSGAIAIPHTPDEAPRGLQLEGVAARITKADEIEHARRAYEGRIFAAEKIDQLLNHPDRPHAFYRITKPRFVLFDALNFPDSPQRELTVS